MRRLLLCWLLVAAVTAVGGCAAETPGATGPAGAAASVPTTDPSAPAATADPVESYAVLVWHVNGFFRALEAAEQLHPAAVPETAEDILALADYELEEGVALDTYDPDRQRLCFTGPGDTFLALTEVDLDLRRILGTGECDYEDGEVVLLLGVPDDAPGFRLSERVVKGRRLAGQIPGLDEFLDIVNQPG